MDKIKIKNLHIYAYHGVHDFEKEKGQNFYINAVAYVDTFEAGHSDKLEDTVSYSDICRVINDTFCGTKYDLIEAAAEACAENILFSFSKIRKIDIEICKPEAPIEMEFETVSVEISREWHRVFLAVGSNMGDKCAYIDKALELLEHNNGIRINQVSDMIMTKPYGGVEQDDFLNGALEIETIYSPFKLLDIIHEIEKCCERKREIHWGPRTLDLDILLYDDLIIDTDTLTIPHADMQNREFVLKPLNQIAPNVCHPIYRVRVSELLNRLN